jgi:hypothetical protein
MGRWQRRNDFFYLFLGWGKIKVSRFLNPVKQQLMTGRVPMIMVPG